jgi:hypothetical protein
MFVHEPQSQFDLAVTGIVRQGHGAASGRAKHPYPDGTLALQFPIFRAQHVDLSGFYRGTLNVDLAPARFVLEQADVTLRQVRWTDRIPPEDFSFFACLLEFDGARFPALIYRPHPETKVEHFQNDSILEIMAPHVRGIGAGSRVVLRVRSRQVKVELPESAGS